MDQLRSINGAAFWYTTKNGYAVPQVAVVVAATRGVSIVDSKEKEANKRLALERMGRWGT